MLFFFNETRNTQQKRDRHTLSQNDAIPIYLTEPDQNTPLAPAAVSGCGNVFALTGRFEPDGTEDQEATESTDGGTNNNNLNEAAGSGTVSYLWGENGNDTLNGGNGSDILNGGPGRAVINEIGRAPA